MTYLAEVVDDCRAGRVRPAVDNPRLQAVAQVLIAGADGPLIDATFIYKTYMAKDKIAIYEDHPSIMAPWRTAWVGYRNEHGNANVTLVVSSPWPLSQPWESSAGNDMSAAEHRLTLAFFTGGLRGDGRRVPTTGPITITRIAVSATGEPLDIQWNDLLGDGRPEMWDWHRWTVLGTYGLLGARNIKLIENPATSRADRRRELRLGVRSHVLAITGTGQRRPGRRGGVPDPGLPLHSVRGHWAHYGACCPHHEPRGLLFGRHTGRVWVPQSARGSADVGSVEQSFIVVDR